MARDNKLKSFFLPKVNAQEAAIVEEVNIYPVENLKTLFWHLTNQQPLEKIVPISYESLTLDHVFDYDLKDIHGQQQAKRALEIAAAGSHNMLFKGPPGAGKTLLARTLASILPLLTFNEMLEVTKIYSISGLLGKIPS